MPAYLLVEAEVHDYEASDRYRSLAEPTIAQHGGRYLIKGAVPKAAEGAWPSARVTTVIEFPDMARLEKWYASAEYQQAVAARAGAMEVRLLFAEGMR